MAPKAIGWGVGDGYSITFYDDYHLEIETALKTERPTIYKVRQDAMESVRHHLGFAGSVDELFEMVKILLRTSELRHA